MATTTVSAFSVLHPISTPTFHKKPRLMLTSLPMRSSFHFKQPRLVFNTKHGKQKGVLRGFVKGIRSVEEETPVPESIVEEEVATEVVDEQGEEQSEEQQTVSVPVSPSDTITMFLQAEGTMSESAIPTVTKALEDVEGVADLKIQVLEGIASVELTKQTTVQATGVASGLVELIQGSGFKLQTLNLSFEDEEDIVLV